MPAPNDNSYRVIRKGKRDYRSQITETLAFEYKIFMNTPSLQDEINFADFGYLCCLERLSIKHGRAISILVLSRAIGYSVPACTSSLRRMLVNGQVIRISPSLWDVTVYGGQLIKRYNRKMQPFLSGKLKLPFV